MSSRRPLPFFSKRFLSALLIAALSSAVAPASAETITVPRADFPATKPQIGVNLEGIADFGRSMMFADAMKSARKFGSVVAPWDENASRDKDGWPTTDCGVVVMADAPVKAGDYLFSCTGKCEVGLVASKGTVKNQGYDRQKNITTGPTYTKRTWSSAVTGPLHAYEYPLKRQEGMPGPACNRVPVA